MTTGAMAPEPDATPIEDMALPASQPAPAPQVATTPTPTSSATPIEDMALPEPNTTAPSFSGQQAATPATRPDFDTYLTNNPDMGKILSGLDQTHQDQYRGFYDNEDMKGAAELTGSLIGMGAGKISPTDVPKLMSKRDNATAVSTPAKI